MAFLSRVSRTESKEKATKNAKLQQEAAVAAAEAQKASKRLFAVPSLAEVGRAAATIGKTIATDPAKVLLVKPADRLAEAVGRTGVLGKNIKTGYEAMADAGESRKYGFVEVEAQKGGKAGAYQIAGDALKSASYLAPVKGIEKAAGGVLGGNVRRAAVATAASGGAMGALAGAGDQLQREDRSIGAIARAIAVGGGVGTVAGGTLGGVLARMSRSAPSRAAAPAAAVAERAIATRADDFAGMTLAERLAATGERKLPVYGDTTLRRIPVDGQSRTARVPFVNDYRPTGPDIQVGATPKGTKLPVAAASPATGAKAPPGLRYEMIEPPKTPAAASGAAVRPAAPATRGTATTAPKAAPATVPAATAAPKAAPTVGKTTSDARTMVQNHITESREVVENLPKADLDRNGGMPALLERTKTNIVDGLKAEGRADVSAAVSKISTKGMSSLDDFSRQVDDALGAIDNGKPAAAAPKLTGDTKQSGLARSVEAKAVEKKLADSFDGVSEYSTINIKEQADLADDLIRRDPDRARRIALGIEDAPEGTKAFAVYTAMEQQAIKGGDVDTLRALATQSRLNRQSSESAQTLRLLAERDPESPVTKIAEVAAARAKAAARRGIKDPEKAVAAGVKEAKAAMAKAPKAPKEDWSSFVDSITC